MRYPGFEGTPVSPRQLEWLLHRSCSLGLPAPLTLGAAEDAEWDRDDLGEFTDHVTWTAVPYGRTIVVRGEADGAEIQRHVCVLSVGRMTDLEIPLGVPWIQRTDQLPFPVEWSGRVTIEDAGRVGLAMRRNIQRIRSQKEHYEHEHAEPAPGGLDRQASKALVVEDELSSGLSGLSTRTAGWYRIAVSGATQEEALDRATGVRQLFAPQVTISRPADQYAVARELIPGEKLGTTAMRGLFPSVVAGAAWAALVLAVVAAITQYPSRASSFFDDTITSTIGSLQSRTAGVDASTQPGESSARAQGALTVDRVLYDGWLRGQLGSSDSPAAERWGPTLFRASALTWSESAAASTPEAMNQLNEEKASQWKDTADEIAEQDPATYAVLQGTAGGRMGTGLMALFGAVFVDLFRLVADIFLLAGLVMLRLLVMFLPAAAVIGVLAPLSGSSNRWPTLVGPQSSTSSPSRLAPSSTRRRSPLS